MTQNIFMNQEKYKEIKATASKLNLTVEEYLVDLHDRNKCIRSILLHDSEDFKNFVQEYHLLLDTIVQYKQEILENTGAKEDSMKVESIHELLKLQMTDIVLMTQLYGIYSKIEKRNPQIEFSASLEI